MSSPTIPQVVQDRPKDYFKLHKQILKISGVSLNPNESITYKMYSFFILSTTIFAFSILDTYELFKHDFQTSSGIMMYQVTSVITAIKAIAMLLNRIKIGKVFAKLEEEPFLPNLNRGGEEEEKLIKECISKTNIQTYVYWGYTTVFVIACCLFALSTRITSSDYHDWQLPYGPFTVLDITYSPNYEIMLLYQSICICLFSGIYVTTDLVIAGVLAHISYQFKIFQNFLKVIVEHGRQEMLGNEGQASQERTTSASTVVEESPELLIHWSYLQKYTKEAVQYHIAILNLAKEMEESFRYMLLVTFLAIMALLCLETYELSYENTVNGIMRHITEYTAGSLPAIIICYWGEKIMSQSKEVGTATLESDYVGTDIRFQKALVMITCRSQVPTKLTAGKFADICFNTCIWILKSSYSLCMVLRNTNKK